jgi:hypothetical protein
MHTSSRPASLWVAWLSVVSAGVMLFGLVLALAPAVARYGFSLLIYADPAHISSFGAEAVKYIGLAHAVLGGVMFGWGFALLLIVRRLFARGSKLGWQLISFSVVAWFIPDTIYSLSSGFWQNAVLNLVLVVLFAVPLLASYRVCNAANV